MRKISHSFLMVLLLLSAAAQEKADCAAGEKCEPLLRWLQDFPQLRWYRSDSYRLAQVKDPDRIVFIGDSHIQSWDLNQFSFGKHVVNRGISGQTTPQMVLRFRQDVILLRPKAVVIMAGINDVASKTGSASVEMIENNYESMAEQAQANGVKVVFLSVLPVNDYGTTKQTSTHDPQRILDLDHWLIQYCARKGLVYVDLFTLVADASGAMRRELSNDGLHLNAAGYRAIMRPTAAGLQQALGSRR